MIASATSAVTPVHTGAQVHNRRGKAEAFHSNEAGKVSSASYSENSTDEEDALLEREEERLMLEDEAEHHMLNVALAKSVEDANGEGTGVDRSRDEVSMGGIQGQVASNSLREADKRNEGCPIDACSLAANRKVSKRGRKMKEEIKGSKVPSEAPRIVPTAVPTVAPNSKYAGQRRTRRSIVNGAIADQGKSGSGVWLGTRKRRREQAMKQVPTETGDVECSSERSCVDGCSESCTPSANHCNANDRSVVVSDGSNSVQLQPRGVNEKEPGLKKDVVVKTERCQPTDTQSDGGVNSAAVSKKSILASPIGVPVPPDTRASDGKVRIMEAVPHPSNHPTPVLSTAGNIVATSESSKLPSTASMQPPALPSRRRIFSVDLDPAGFDFESSMGVTWSSPACISATGNSENVQPLAPVPQPRVGTATPAPTVSNPLSDAQQGATAVFPPSAAVGRDRGMSFELFSFGVNAEEPLPPAPVAAGHVDASSDTWTGRPRGDSIIFDPISFSDGGIHEESALQRARNTSISMEDTDELEIMNSPGFVEAPASCLKQPSVVQHRPPPAPPLTAKAPASHKLPVPSPLVRTDTSVPSPLNQVVSNPVSHPALSPLPVPSSFASGSESGTQSTAPKPSAVLQKEAHRQRGKKVAAPLLPVGTSTSSSAVPLPVTSASSPPTNDGVINMPHGSAAAAAATMTVPSTVVPSSLNGTPTSHTACPMELLNKGGRIGIYLPDARKERIAKFHSKRKMRIWRKRIKYDCRKKLADSRPRIKGRFVKRSDMDDEE
eukprot:CAMPEP_0197442922 /NCGR_PEP_ID=MMETSP1175-20131217/8815_1 /TAXON_ID=1003142 /ORGANISM="Triceratium dubium, Strain CCMP147" /LENGTH=777 /DNA_ID=CAMNT_0042973483 /DNA_START=154 /DNA_END=2487 /DNA_ORIENTATION=-